ncbi:MAG TPA: endolytic transglycosylase MltG, partial [Myxococcota bacterium]
MNRGVTVLLCLVALVGGGALYAYKMRLLGFAHAPGQRHNRDTIVVEVPRGATPAEIGALLEQHGVVSDRALFAGWVKSENAASSLKAGTYELSPSMTPAEILDTLLRGRDYEVRFTVPEGLGKRDVAMIIAAAGFGDVDDIVAVMDSPALQADFGVPATGADGNPGVPGGIEGYLFPDTYQFAPGTPIDQILKRMRRRLDNMIDEPMRQRMAALGWDLHTTLTMAALIEEETARGDERAHISAVFHNRHKKGMKLQTDPTVVYGVDDYNGVIKKRH